MIMDFQIYASIIPWEQTGTVVVPVSFMKNLNTQEFYFSFDFAEFAGTDKTEINYYFEVFDNDNLSGPKSTRSSRLNLPDSLI